MLLLEAFRGGKGGAFSSFSKSSPDDITLVKLLLTTGALLLELLIAERDAAPFLHDNDDDFGAGVTSVGAPSMLDREMLVWVAKLPFMLCVVVGGGNGGNGVCVA